MDKTLHFCVQKDDVYLDHMVYPTPAACAFTPHTHDVCELLFVKSGQVSYLADGRSYPLAPNSLVFIRPACVHQIRVEGPGAYERYDMLYDVRGRLPKLYRALESRPPVTVFADNPTVIALFEKLDGYYGRFAEEEFLRLVSLFAEELLYNVLACNTAFPEQEFRYDNPLILQAVRYIEEHIATLRGVGDICSALYITKSHLHHLFTRYLQITPKKYILSKRLTLAQISIRAGSKPTEVYASLGFHNYSTFYRDYLAFFGHRPSEEPSVTRTQSVEA